jgi:hypothetical protein
MSERVQWVMAGVFLLFFAWQIASLIRTGNRVVRETEAKMHEAAEDALRRFRRGGV